MNEGGGVLNELRPHAVHDARNAWIVTRPWTCWALATAVLCLLLAVLGAVDSYSVPLGARLVFWSGLFAVGLLFAIGIEAVLLRAGLAPDPAWRWLLVFSLVLALAMTPVAYVANSAGGWAPLTMLFPHFGYSLIISLAFVGLRMAIGRLALPSHPVEAVPAIGAPLMERLPPALRDARLQAIEADGHYVRIHTDRGSEMVLMRLKDAIRETGSIEGMQIHRGWWIAREAVREFRTVDGKSQVVIATGKHVPVSRSRRAELREAGWL